MAKTEFDSHILNKIVVPQTIFGRYLLHPLFLLLPLRSAGSFFPLMPGGSFFSIQQSSLPPSCAEPGRGSK
jgi:hypothetical protein